MEKTSGAEGRERRGDEKTDLFFPSDGHFSRVVPLSEAGEEVAPSAIAAAPEEPDEATLIPARARRRTLQAREPRQKKRVEQSWGFMAAVLAVSVTAGIAAGAYMIRSQRTAETSRPGTPAAEAATANGAVEKVVAAETAEQPVPQAPAPQVEDDRLAAATASAAAPTRPTASSSDEAETKVENVNPSKPAPKASARADVSAARRVVEPEPRAERPARASSEAREATPAPRVTRSEAAPRRVERTTAANAPPPQRSPPISSPPPSARPKKVIQWP